jgi:lipoic acid synthetase
MHSQDTSGNSSRIPPWLRVSLPRDANFAATEALTRDLRLHTVCSGAKCPNKWECYSRRVATFLVLGPVCTRNCAFCNITPGTPAPVDPDEPRRVAEAVARLGLTYAVVTSVTRDDLPDGGAGHFAAVIRAIREDNPGCGVEVLIPDFQGDEAALRAVLHAAPDVLNHNLETVPGLYSRIRPQADYGQSLELLRRARGIAPAIPTKSGLMLGLGEEMDDVRAVLRDLAGIGCAIVTVGQYMRPSRKHPEVARWVHPDEFATLAEYGKSLGVRHMFCAPLVRSSYHAAEAKEAAG